MLHPEFYNYVRLVAGDDKYVYSVLTNGSYIDGRAITFFKNFSPLFIQLSLEGSESTHDKIRGSGDFKRTTNVASMLTRAGIRTMISFTAHKENYKEFEAVANIARNLKVYKVWTDRLIPYGSGNELVSMSVQETKDYIRLIKRVKDDKRYNRCRTIVSDDRALQFFAGGKFYSCSAGKSLLTVMPNGVVYPCRRMPVDVGDIYKNSLLDIYSKSNFLNELRGDKTITDCEECRFVSRCKGGLKCLSYAVKDDAFAKDSGCWVGN